MPTEARLFLCQPVSCKYTETKQLRDKYRWQGWGQHRRERLLLLPMG